MSQRRELCLEHGRAPLLTVDIGVITSVEEVLAMGMGVGMIIGIIIGVILVIWILAQIVGGIF